MRAILFDWDGTIVDSIAHLFDAYAVVCRRFGLPFDREIFLRAFAPDWRLMYRRMGMPPERIEEAGRVWTEAFLGHEVRLFPNVASALERLASAGYSLGIVTGGYHEVIWPQLERHRLAHLFPVRVFGNDTVVGKPDPRPLRLAIDRIERERARSGGRSAPIDPADIAYVGDALDDMRMAASVGARGVGILSLLADEGQLRAAGAADVTPSVVEWTETVLAGGRSRPAR